MNIGVVNRLGSPDEKAFAPIMVLTIPPRPPPKIQPTRAARYLKIIPYRAGSVIPK